jgi:hypothetical protein
MLQCVAAKAVAPGRPRLKSRKLVPLAGAGRQFGTAMAGD